MKILLLGKNGQVGWELQRALAPLGDVVACGRAEVDLGIFPEQKNFHAYCVSIHLRYSPDTTSATQS